MFCDTINADKIQYRFPIGDAALWTGGGVVPVCPKPPKTTVVWTRELDSNTAETFLRDTTNTVTDHYYLSLISVKCLRVYTAKIIIFF